MARTDLRKPGREVHQTCRDDDDDFPRSLRQLYDAFGFAPHLQVRPPLRSGARWFHRKLSFGMVSGLLSQG